MHVFGHSIANFSVYQGPVAVREIVPDSVGLRLVESERFARDLATNSTFRSHLERGGWLGRGRC